MNKITSKARKIRLLLLDVDGILTDGRILYDEKGRETKYFHVHDGQGIRWLLSEGIKVGFLSGRSSGAVEMRAKELDISFLFQGIKDKMVLYGKLLQKTKLDPEQVSFMGDDFVDLRLLKSVGLSVSVSNGHPLVRKEVDYVTQAAGGFGAVREVSELIFKAQGKWESILRNYGLKSKDGKY
ncbi:MAG: HAD-IIIA family hydrolase [Deltaproteobacteria bacterium]|nr:HAD-IIIA family hydrolase [Deltaproteobacteria bacterium]